jgi:hypothetical protein
MNPSIAFTEIERSVTRARAYAALAQTSKHIVEGLFLTWKVSHKLKEFVDLLTPRWIESIDADDAAKLTADLQELHTMLVHFSRDGADLRRFAPFLNSSIKSIQESTENIGDIIEDLVLSQDTRYKALVMQCAESLGLGHK